MNLWQSLPEIRTLLAELKQAGIDPDQHLLPYLGSHAALAVYPDAGTTPEQAQGAVLLSLALKSSQSGTLLDVWLRQQFKPLSLGGETVYQIENAQVPEMFRGLLAGENARLNLTVRPDHLLLIFSNGQDIAPLLKPAQSLLQDAAFMGVSKEMKTQKIWGYLDQAGLKMFSQALQTAGGESPSSAEPMLDRLQGMAFGIKSRAEGLDIEVYSPYLDEAQPSALRQFLNSLVPRAKAWCQVWRLTEQALNEPGAVADRRPAGREILLDYMRVYADECPD